MPSTAERIQELRIQRGLRDADLAAALGLTPAAYVSLERDDAEIESTLSIRQAQQLAQLLGTELADLLTARAAPAAPAPPAVPIAMVRAALAAQLAHSPDAREALEDAIDWDLGPFLDATDEWTTVYTLDFLRRLAALVDVDLRRLLMGLERL